MEPGTYSLPRYKIFSWLLLSFVFTIPLSQYLSVRLLVVVAIISFFIADVRKSSARLLTNAWDIGLYFLALLLGLSYSEDVLTGLRTLETSFSLMAIPIVFSVLSDFNKRESYRIFYAFVLGLLLACIICMSSAFLQFAVSGDPQVFFFEQLTHVLNLQPTYVAYYLIFSIGFGLYLSFYHETRVPAFIPSLIMIFFFFFLMLSGGRTAFISLLLIFSFFVLKYLLETRTADKNRVFAIVCFMLISLFAVNSLDYWSEYWSIKSDYWERSILWESAIQANPDPLFGVGTGDYKTVLNEYYLRHGLNEFAQDSYNAHNQFIQIYFSNGIIGLIALLLVLGRPLYLALRSHDTLGILILFPFFIYGMTEVFLGRYQGVVFFALLHQLIAARHFSGKRSVLLEVV